LGLSPAWVRQVKQIRREEHRTTRLPMGGVRVLKIDLEELLQLVQQQPDATIAELHERSGQATLQRIGGGHGTQAAGSEF